MDARWYNPKVGRFIQPDQYNHVNLMLPKGAQSELMRYIGRSQGDLLKDPSQQMRYGYVSGNALRWVDPLGLDANFVVMPGAGDQINVVGTVNILITGPDANEENRKQIQSDIEKEYNNAFDNINLSTKVNVYLEGESNNPDLHVMDLNVLRNESNAVSNGSTTKVDPTDTVKVASHEISHNLGLRDAYDHDVNSPSTNKPGRFASIIRPGKESNLMGDANIGVLDKNDILGLLTITTEHKTVVNPTGIELGSHVPNLPAQLIDPSPSMPRGFLPITNSNTQTLINSVDITLGDLCN